MNKFLLALGGSFVFSLVLVGFGFLVVTGQTCSLLNKEFSAESLLKKYEWFKNTASMLDAMSASLEIKEAEVKLMENSLSPDKTQWSRIDKEMLFQSQKELMGMKMAYNNLAGQYNAQMSKVNWQFTNMGSLPHGATVVLPREFRAYK
jgi:hypothetical protein